MAAVDLDRRTIHDRCKRNQLVCGPPLKADPRVRSSPKRDVGENNRAPAGCNPPHGADPTGGAAPPPGPGAHPGGRDHRRVSCGRLAAEGTTVKEPGTSTAPQATDRDLSRLRHRGAHSVGQIADLTIEFHIAGGVA